MFVLVLYAIDRELEIEIQESGPSKNGGLSPLLSVMNCIVRCVMG